jgi:VWFA-related protein
MNMKRIPAIGLFAALFQGGAAAQELPAPIRVDVNLVNVLCSVRDKKGGLIGTLNREDFTLFEDGKQQEIKYFTRETDLPLTIGLLVDVSGSQANLISEERQAAHQFFSQVLRKKDMAFLISFGADSELLQDSTNSVKLLDEGLGRLRLNAGVGGLHPGPVPTAGQPRGTVMFDAVYLAANERLSKEVGRKAIVLITDGEDQGSRLDRAAAIEAAQKADSIIYSIYYVDNRVYMGRGGFIRAGDGDLKKMSEETGGRVHRVDRRNTLEQIFKQIQEEMRSQYSIGYTPREGGSAGGFRHIEIRMADKNLKAQARKGYYASKPE